MLEPGYARVDRLAAEKVRDELAKPLADPDDPQDSDKEFDPWSLFPALYGRYSSEFDHCAIQVLEDVRDGTHNRPDLAAQMFREMLCTSHLCDYGSSPRVCFPTAEFGKVLPELIEKWKAYYLSHWQSAYAPD